MKKIFIQTAFLLFIFQPAFGWDKEGFSNIEQPINFSHERHVQKNGMACEYCHSSARNSINAGIPPVRTCIGCHIIVKGQTPEQQQEIAKVQKYWDDKEPIPWKKIHDLPDFVYFSHKKHVNVGFDCTSCHGDVTKTKTPVPMELYGETPLSMGWCMSCHRDSHPVNKDGKIALPIRKTRGGKIIREADKVHSTIKGNVDCTVCHK